MFASRTLPVHHSLAGGFRVAANLPPHRAGHVAPNDQRHLSSGKQVVFHPKAGIELDGLPLREWAAMMNAVEKIRAAGLVLPLPHQSGVQGVEKLRELHLRAGRSPWRGSTGVS